MSERDDKMFVFSSDEGPTLILEVTTLNTLGSLSFK
jgi:hypothetical protein